VGAARAAAGLACGLRASAAPRSRSRPRPSPARGSPCERLETQDLELDLVVHPGGNVERKDDALLDFRVREGRFTQDQADAVRTEAERVERELAGGRRWWDPFWALWEPDPAWA
jgi:hypothetical protein